MQSVSHWIHNEYECNVPRDMQVLYKLSHEKVTGDYMCIQKPVFEET